MSIAEISSRRSALDLPCRPGFGILTCQTEISSFRNQDPFGEPADTSAFDILQDVSQRTWGDVTDELLQLSRLPEDWDGMGAASPSSEVVQNCFRLMRDCRRQEFLPPDLIRPTPDGNVAFEWYDGDARLEMEVSADTLDLIRVDSSGRLDYQQVPIPIG